ncbi:cache domain-containing protein [Patescibacteria group bacterium]|nr:cache domain-containing protein [Patescibacteria group bacterium]MBU0777291.1 cache domain-containing protein [Patescibacteria group bacterium]MBU0846280.1 cache domain-containing protein [Patescibacteria group bacterium]MBU0923183.1 cache domain-containing protein [Patescibacteria group bacterium]MBU1066897.1 cache domain-containing protein [Patescibacteria group bacterium]
MFKRLALKFSNLFNSIFFFALLLLVFLGVVFYVFLGKGARDALTEQMLHREQSNARAGASSIATFFELIGNSVVIMSDRDEIVKPGPQTDIFLESAISRWENTPVTNIILTDRDGKVIKAAYRELPGEADISLADREYFIWAKNAESSDYYVSAAVESRLRGENYYVVPIVSPVIDKGGDFNGVLIMGVSVSSLTDQYMNHLKISDKTEIYIIKRDGNFIYATDEELQGGNAIEFIIEHPFLGNEILAGRLKELLKNVQEGKLEVAYPENVGTVFPLKTRLIAYSPISTKDREWILVIATPTEDILVSMTPIYFRQAVSVLIIFLAFLGFSVRFAKIYGYKEAMKVLHKEKKPFSKTSK